MAAPGYPIINGNRFDYSSVTIRINGKKYTAVQSIDYAASLEPGMVYGQNTPLPVGRTRGQLKTDDANIEILREDFGDLAADLQSLALGLFEANFVITCSFSEAPNPLAGTPQLDTIVGCRFKRFSMAAKVGPDPTAVKLDFTFMNLLVNGTSLVSLNKIINV